MLALPLISYVDLVKLLNASVLQVLLHKMGVVGDSICLIGILNGLSSP